MKRIALSALAASLVLSPVTKAQADGDALVGGIVGGIIGGVIVNEANRNRHRPRTTTTVVRPGVTSATRAANAETQTALNYFGFNAGPADGVLGRGSRTAMASYQAHLGYPPTGDLTPYERDFLVTSYQRAMAGGAMTAQMIASNPMGAKGLLTTYRDEQFGRAPSQQMVAAPQQVIVPVPAPATTEVAAPQPAAPAAPSLGGLANLMGGGVTTQVSLASHCNQVSLLTSTNGGFVTLANLGDPLVALDEQFCLARTYVISEGERLAAGVQGFTPQQIAAQCEGFGPAMREQIAALSLKPAAEVLPAVSGFALTSGIAPAQLAGTSKICLSVGYRTDNMDVALASALLLTALGEPSYGELVGHHLVRGFGTTPRTDLSVDWFDMSFAAAAAGAKVVAPGQPERTELLRQAAYTMTGRAAIAPQGSTPVPAAAVLPVLPVPAPAPAAAPTVAPTVAPTTAPTKVVK